MLDINFQKYILINTDNLNYLGGTMMTKIDIISGFLGAGKTTLIKKLINEALTGEKLVIIENEFGEIGIDGGFLKDSGIEITEMNSGCICCSLVGDFGTALKEVIDKYSPDRIIIEPSGVGKLSDVMKAVLDVKEHADIVLNSATTVVDCSKAKMYIKNFGEFFNNQIESAGAVILSRTQSSKAGQVEDCVARIKELNANAAIVTTSWDDISASAILGAMEHTNILDNLINEVIEEHHHEHHHEDASICVCGQPMGEGVGHSRSMGRAGFAVAGGFLILNSFLLEWLFPDQEFASELSAVLGAIVLALPIVWVAIKDLCAGRVYMNELVAMALLASFAGGVFREAGIIAFFLLITIIIETRTASGAQRSIEDLIRLTPHTARKLVGGDFVETEVLDLQLGDIINVRPGENFPIDGQIVKGQSAVNQASITGESLPVDKGAGDEVYAGTMNLSGAIDVKVTKVGNDTTLGKVKEMILAAETSKTPMVRIIDKYAGFYTPTILMLAALTWWFSDGDMNRVITLMVIACPCAVVLATPTAVVAAIAAAARLGILIKNVAHLELASKVKSFVFDKTGTLTKGELEVARLKPVDGVEPAELLLTAVSVEIASNHPTALALQRLAREVGVSPAKGDSYEELPGKGVEALIGGVKCLVGRPAWIQSQGIALPHDESEVEGMSVVVVVRNGRALGWIGFRDQIRPEAAQMVRELKAEGIRQCAMATGDRTAVATMVAGKIGIDDFRGDCLPQGKVEYVEQAKKADIVAFVGDGVNDAPALAASDLSIAMGAIGSDIAINSASIALMTNDLRRIPLLITLSKKSASVINQNLVFGMFFVICGIILSVFGQMSPILAAVLHTLSTLIVIFNSARLVRTGEEITRAENAAGQ